MFRLSDIRGPFLRVARPLARRLLGPSPSRERVSAALERGDRIVVAEADWAGIYSFVRPLVREMSNRRDVHCAVVTRADQALALAWDLALSRRFSWCNWSIWAYEWLADFPGVPSMLLSSQPFSGVAHCFSGLPKIQTLHGMADKRGELFGTENLRTFTHLFSMGPFVTRLAQQRLRDRGTAAPLQIVPTGCPKTDQLLDGTWSRDRVLTGFGLPADRPTVLYAPTWEKAASFERFGPEIIERLCRLPINVLVKPHHLSLGDPKSSFLIEQGHGGRDWRPILRAFERRFPNLRWVRQSSANPSMVAADLLVSEGSGIAYEYLLLNRPIVFVTSAAPEGDAPMHKRYHEYAEVVPDPPGLEQATRRALADPKGKQAARERVVQDIAYNRGHATSAAMKEIVRLLELRSK